MAVGAALLSKYTALFFGPAILIWLHRGAKAAALAAVALALSRRRWLRFAMFSPVILWNADHHWVSFIKQFGRARIEDFRPAFIAELVPTQVAFATPLVFILGAMGLACADTGARPARCAARVLVNAMFWTIVVYFIWHSLHARVEANWFAPVYPAFAIAAAVAAHLARWQPRWQRARRFLPALGRADRHRDVRAADRAGQYRRAVGLSPRRHRAQRRRRLARDSPREIEAVRERVGATCVLAPDYGTTGWLVFYLPKGTCVAQQTQRIRWVNMPEPDPALLPGKLLYVDEVVPDGRAVSEETFRACRERSAKSQRKRGPLVIETYALDLLEGPERATCSTARRRRNWSRDAEDTKKLCRDCRIRRFPDRLVSEPQMPSTARSVPWPVPS